MNIYKKFPVLALIALFSLTTTPSGFALAYGHDEIEATHVFVPNEVGADTGTHTISGSVEVSSPQHALNVSVLVAESFPEQITLRFETELIPLQDGLSGIQITVDRDFEVEVEAHEDATFSATVNGEEVELDLEEIDDDDDDSDDDSDEDEDEDNDDSDSDDDEDEDEDDDSDDNQSLWDRVLALLEMVKQLQNRLAEMTGSQGEVRPELNQATQLTRQLVRGMSGDDVRKLQELLATDPQIYPEGLVTGFFGPLTERAVQRFQVKFRLNSTGEVNSQTLSRINEILKEGVGPEGKIPPGLLRAPGIISLINGSAFEDNRGPRSHIQGQFEQDQEDSDSDNDGDYSDPSDPPEDED